MIAPLRPALCAAALLVTGCASAHAATAVREIPLPANTRALAVDGDRVVALSPGASGGATTTIDGSGTVVGAAPLASIGPALRAALASAPPNRTCTIGNTTYPLRITPDAILIERPQDRRTMRVPVRATDAACINSRSGVVLGAVERTGDVSALAIFALPSLQQMTALPAPAGSDRIVAGPLAAYVYRTNAATATAAVFPASALDFREELWRAISLTRG